MSRFLYNSIHTLLAVTVLYSLMIVTAPRAEAVAVELVQDLTKNAVNHELSKNLLSFINGIEKSLQDKELNKDPRKWAQSMQGIQDLVKQTGDWAAAGFDGKPAFVTSLEQEYQDITRKSGAENIYSPDLNFSCSQKDEFIVRASLAKYVQERTGGSSGGEAQACTIEDLDELKKGGWNFPDFFELSLGGKHDNVSRDLAAKIDFEIDTLDRIEDAITVWNWGRGFHSSTKGGCSYPVDGSGFPREECVITNPGAVIEKMISYNLGELPAQAILNGDEFNEVTSQVLDGLANQIFSGAAGILGLSAKSSYANNTFGTGSQSYLEALATDSVVTQQTYTVAPIADAIKHKRTLIRYQEKILADIKKLEDQLVTCSSNQLTLTDRLIEIDTEVASELEINKLVLDVLVLLRAELNSAANAKQQNLVYEEYYKLEAQDFITTEIDTIDLKTSFIDYEFKALVDAFKITINGTSCTTKTSTTAEDAAVGTAVTPTINPILVTDTEITGRTSTRAEITVSGVACDTTKILADREGNWTCPIAASSLPLTDDALIIAISTDRDDAVSGAATTKVTTPSLESNAPVIDPVAASSTDITGAAEAGAVITFTDSTPVVICTDAPIVTSSTGTWSCTASTTPKFGDIISAQATAPAENISPMSTSAVFPES